MSAMKDNVQKAAVRVIASELDRRSGSVEQAVTDLAAHVHALNAEQAGMIAELRRQMATVQAQLGDVQQTQARVGRTLDELSARVRTREVDADQVMAAVTGLQAELLAAQEQVAALASAMASGR